MNENFYVSPTNHSSEEQQIFRRFKPVTFVPAAEEKASIQQSIGSGDTKKNTGDEIADFYRQQHPTAKSYASHTITAASTDKLDSKSTVMCHQCQKEILEEHWHNHKISIAHMTSMQRDKPPIVYGLNETNIGYKMLVKEGWTDTQRGLGAEEQGRTRPISVRRKVDRSGVGGGKKRLAYSDKDIRQYGGSDEVVDIGGQTGGSLRAKQRREQEYERQKARDRAILAYLHQRPNG